MAFAARGLGHRLAFLGAIWLVIGSVWIILGNARINTLITDLGFALLAFGLVSTTVGLARWDRDLKRKRNT